MAKNEKKADAVVNQESAMLPAPVATRPRHLPGYRVLLHNDDKNYVDHVIQALVALTPLNKEEAARCTDEANRNGVSLILVVHKERAELYVEQFRACHLTVTIEPVE